MGDRSKKVTHDTAAPKILAAEGIIKGSEALAEKRAGLMNTARNLKSIIEGARVGSGGDLLPLLNNFLNELVQSVSGGIHKS